VLVVGNVIAGAAVGDVAATLVNVVAIACPSLNLRKHSTIPYTTAIMAINTKPVTNVSECVVWLVCMLFSHLVLFICGWMDGFRGVKTDVFCTRATIWA
jgi:hypothetical protein